MNESSLVSSLAAALHLFIIVIYIRYLWGGLAEIKSNLSNFIIPFLFSLFYWGWVGGGETLSTYPISLLIMIIELVYFVVTPTLF